MKNNSLKLTALMLSLLILLTLSACSDIKTAPLQVQTDVPVFTGSLELRSASQFSADYYEGGYVHVHVADGTDYVLVPREAEASDLGIIGAVIIPIPVQRVYLAASSVMDFFIRLNLPDSLIACSTRAEDYSLPEAAQLIENGTISYVGKYSAPDYETLLSQGCELAIESTMIYHSPSVKEHLESLGIPVFVERSSYESSPMGRLEWIKLYGLLLGCEDEAEAFFNSETDKLSAMISELELCTGSEAPTAAFFYISSNGYVNVRKPGDYISSMIEMAGGRYFLEASGIPEENALSTMNINWEDFYAAASDADILVYNSTVDGGVNTVEDLISKNSLFADFKAVNSGSVYCTNMNMFQRSSAVADVILDFYRIFSGTESEGLSYIYRLTR